MRSTAIMETPEKNILDVLSDYWKSIAVLIGAVTVLFGYLKFIRGKFKALREWVRCFIDAPKAVVAMRSELALENGLSFKQWVAGVDGDLKGIRRMLTFETISRRTLWDSIDSPIFEAGIDGRFQWANRAFLNLAECTLDEVLGLNWRNGIAVPDRQEVVDGWDMAVRDGTDFKAKFRLMLDNGEKWVRFDVICNKDDLVPPNVLGFTGKMWEIADPRQANALEV